MSGNSTIVRTSHVRRIKSELAQCPLLYLSGYFSSGKTVLMRQLAGAWPGRSDLISCRSSDWFQRAQTAVAGGCSLLLLDDIPAEHCDALSRLLDSLPSDVCCVMSGRALCPENLRTASALGHVSILGQEFLAFEREEIQMMLVARGLETDNQTLDWVEETTQGWVLTVSIYAQIVTQSPHLALDDVYQRMGRITRECCVQEIIQNLAPEDLRLLREMSLFSSFTGAMAVRVCNVPDAPLRLRRMSNSGRYISESADGSFVLARPFHILLSEQMLASSSKEYIASLYLAAAGYYEEHGQVRNALACYKEASSLEDIARLLEEYTLERPTNIGITELEPYYFMLPKERVARSPRLMESICLLYSLACQPEESERIFAALENYASSVPKNSVEYRMAQESLLYLRIGLPHRGSKDMVALLKTAAQAIATPAFRLHAFNVAGNGPSVLSGGKDFCTWLPRCRTLHRMLKTPAEKALGPSGTGLGNIALGEALFELETSGNYSESITLLTNGLMEAEEKQEYEMQFAAQAVLSRIFAAEGSVEIAMKQLRGFVSRLPENAPVLLRQNAEGALVWLSMLLGDKLAVRQWMDGSAPDESVRFFTFDRYRLLLKARLYILYGRNVEAQALLARLERYFLQYKRPYGQAQTALLQAMLRRQSGKGDWRPHIQTALAIAEKYGMLRVFADEGAAILDMLTEMKLPDTPQNAALLALTRRQAALYPRYMQPVPVLRDALTSTEQTIYAMIIAGRSNSQIAASLNVTLRTIKFHTANIYRKLGVKNRTQAILRAADFDEL